MGCLGKWHTLLELGILSTDATTGGVGKRLRLDGNRTGGIHGIRKRVEPALNHSESTDEISPLHMSATASQQRGLPQAIRHMSKPTITNPFGTLSCRSALTIVSELCCFHHGSRICTKQRIQAHSAPITALCMASNDPDSKTHMKIDFCWGTIG